MYKEVGRQKGWRVWGAGGGLYLLIGLFRVAMSPCKKCYSHRPRQA